MITISKQDNGVLFTFENSDKYLYGSGTILVPFNSLSIVADESDMITLKKAASNDIFLSARYDTDLGYRSKDDAIDDLKDLLFAETGGGSGSGVTPSEVQEMIDESISGMSDDIQSLEQTKADTSAVTAVANDVSTVSGQVATKVAISDFNAYSAATDSRLAEDEEVTAAALNNLDETKQGKLAYYEENTSGKTATIHIEDTENGTQSEVVVDSASVDMYAQSNYEEESSAIETHTDIWGNSDGIAMTYEKNIDDAEAAHCYFNVNEGLIAMEVMANEETTNVDVYSNGVTINGENVATEPYVDAAISGKVDTSAITTAITSGSTDSEIPTAKATYDAIQAGGGGGATYSAGTNISIDTANTINCTLPITADSYNNITIGSGSSSSNQRYNVAIGDGATAGRNGWYGTCIAIGKNASAPRAISIAIGQQANADGGGGIAIGSQTSTNVAQGVAIGVSANATGTTKMNLNNQIKVDTNNQVYIKDKTNTTDVCIQDAIAALGGLKFVQCTQAEYDALVSGGTVDSSTIYFITNVVS